MEDFLIEKRIGGVYDRQKSGGVLEPEVREDSGNAIRLTIYKGVRMKILYGTGNPSKLKAMKKRLENLPVEIIGLKDLESEIPDVQETGKSPLDNAVQKAECYFKAFGMPVFSCDSGLYLEGLPQELQPGVHVRRVNGKTLTDEEMMEYYGGLALKYGNLRAKYKNAICLILDEWHIYKAMNADMEGGEFLITSKPHPIRKEGFPLDSLSLDIESGKYCYDLSKTSYIWTEKEDGFVKFFQECLENYAEEKGDICSLFGKREKMKGRKGV